MDEESKQLVDDCFLRPIAEAQSTLVMRDAFAQFVFASLLLFV